MEVELLPVKGPNALKIIMREGRKRQIREIANQLDYHVISLVRVRFGPLKLGNLKPGHWRHLTNREVMALKRSVQTSKSGKHHGKR
jgi:23S rRNA pseudouridine2605 synthase